MRVLALDLGTSSVRSALFDQRARRIAGSLAQRPLALRSDADGAAELEPAAFQRAVEACIGETLRKQRGAVDLVGVSCFWHSLIGVDAAGAAATPIVTWADTRAAGAAAALRTELDERAVHARTGCMLRPSFWPAKLRWLAERRPRAARRVAQWLGPADWLFQRWGAFAATSPSMASATGLYESGPGAWAWDVLAAARADARAMPLVHDGPLPIARLAQRFPALARAHAYAAIGDGAAANLGAGAARPGVGAITVGTSAAARLVRDDDASPPFGLFRYRIDARRSLVGGAVSNAGNLRAWCLRELRLDDGAALERALARRPGPCATALATPYLYGDRAPAWRDGVHGALVGLSGATTALDLLHALTDAAWQRIAVIVEQLPGADAARFVVGGGVQRSPATLARLADVLGRPLHACEEAETSLRGAAVHVLEQQGQRPPAPATRIVRPRARWSEAYRAQRARLAELERRLFAAQP